MPNNLLRKRKIHKFYTLSQACLQTRCEKQREWLAAFCAVGLQGPLRRAEGMGVKRSDHRERSSQSLPLRSITSRTDDESRPFCFCVYI